MRTSFSKWPHRSYVHCSKWLVILTWLSLTWLTFYLATVSLQNKLLDKYAVQLR